MQARLGTAVVLGTLLASAPSTVAGTQIEQANDNCTLKIIEKSLDAETGMLSVKLWNDGQVPVKEFGVSVVGTDPRDRSRQVFGEGFMNPEGSLAPGGMSVKRSLIGTPGDPSLELSKFEIELSFEIRVDNSFCGDESFIEQSFRRRLRKFVELDAALACLRSRDSGAARLAGEVEELFREVGSCGDEAGQELEARWRAEDPSVGVRVAGSHRSEASMLTDQMLRQFEDGTSAEFLLGVLEEGLEREIERARGDLRPSDLEQVGR